MNLNYESGKVGDYKGNPVYAIEEDKFEPKRANRNFIYALGHQGTSEKLNLIFWDGSNWRELGTVNASGSDRPAYVFGRIEAQKEEDWLKPAVSSPELTNFKAVKIEDLNILSAGIDAYIKEQLNRDWLGEVS